MKRIMSCDGRRARRALLILCGAPILVLSLVAEEPPFDIQKLTNEQIARLFPKRASVNVAQNWPKVRAALETYGLSSSRNLVL